MHNSEANARFDAHYYATGCGTPYVRNDEWMAMFQVVAGEITTRIAPTTVLDAGCAIGLLVEQLRNRGVDAEGVDISEYAISQAHESVRPFVRVGSVTEPLPRRYDLIVCIEVLEHMERAEAEQAVAVFCNHTSDVLFSSSPDDYKEATHFNVNPPEYWAELFARHNFFRDVDFDASFITPWAVRFRRRSEPLARIVRDYERRFKQLWKEALDLRTLSNEQRTQLRDLDSQRSALAGQLELSALSHEQQSQIAAFQQQRAELASQLAHKDQALGLLQRQLAEHEQAYRALQRQGEFMRLAAQLDRQGDPLIALLAEAHTYSQRLEKELARRDEHIAHLESIIRAFENGRIMSMLRQLQRRSPIMPAPASADPAAPQQRVAAPAADPAARYARWIAANEPDAAALAQQRIVAQQLPLRPLISLITPVYNPPLAALQALIASLRAQTYDRWEFCVADASSDPTITRTLQRLAEHDPRIRFRRLSQNGGISINANAALELAAGTFVLLLDHDDTLAAEALFQVAQTINAHPEAEIIYYDEDKLSADGTLRHSPWFKPGRYSPDLMLSTNYLMHGVFRRTLVEAVGRFAHAAEGAQDWDLALRCLEQTQAIYHIPRVLYHWRQVPGSAASDANAKPWALAGQEYALRSHLDRIGAHEATLQRLSPSDLRISWPTRERLVSIIIPNRDQPDLLRACLNSIFTHTRYAHYELLIIDNQSTDPRTLAYYAELQADPRVRVIPFDAPFNWSQANNLGVAHAQGELLLFLNNDTEIREAAWLDELVGWIERPEVGLVGCRLVRPDGTTQHAGMALGLAGHASHLFDGAVTPTYGPFGSSEWYRNLLTVTGACMLTRRDVFTAVGGFDQRYQVGYSDITFGLAVHDQGLRVIYTPHTTLLHHEGASRGLKLPAADVLRASFELLPRIAAGDPYFSPNLAVEHCNPSIADPEGEPWQARMARILANFNLIEGAQPAQITALAAQLAALPPRRPPVPGTLCRMLFCSHELSLSGAPLMLVDLARYLVQQGYAVTIATTKAGDIDGLISAAGVGQIIVPELYSDALTSALVMRNYDLVLVNTIFGFRTVHAAHVAGVPCAWWIHEPRFGHALAAHEPAANQALGLAETLIFPAAATAALYGQLHPPTLAAQIHYGIAKPDLNNLAPSTHPGRISIVVPASIEPRKGQDVLLAALRLLPATLLHQLDLYLIGKVLDHQFYLQLRRTMPGLEHVYFTGLLNREQTLAYLANAEIFVLPSRDEVFPVALLEAMAYGKAILVTDVGGVREAVRHGQEALVVPPEDATSLAAELEALLKLPALRARLGAAAQARYEERFTFAAFGAAMEAALRRILPL